MKKQIQIFAIASLLLAGCGRTTTSINLVGTASSDLLLKTREETVERLGRPYKEQSRTGEMFALYFQDAKDTVLSATFKEGKMVDFVVCPGPQIQSESNVLLPKGKEGWASGLEKRFDVEVKVFTETSSGYSIFEKDDCIYFTTNWIRNK